MRKTKLKVILLALLPCMLFILIYKVHVEFAVYDEYQIVMHEMAAMRFSDVPIMNQYFLGYIGYSYLFTFLYGFIPSVSWMAVVEVGTLILATLVYIYLFLKLLSGFFNHFWFLLIALSMILINFLDAYAMITFTRPALLLCGIGVYGILFETTVSQRTRMFFFILFIIGFLLRPEAGIGMVVYVSVAYFILDVRPVYILKKTKLFLLSIVLFMTTVMMLTYFSNDFLYQIEPEVEYKFMQGYYIHPTTFSSAQDSIKYMLATNGFIFDPDVLSADYLRSIQTEYHFIEMFDSFRKYYQILVGKLGFYSFHFWIFLAYFTMSIIYRKWKLLTQGILLSIFTFVVLLFLRTNSGLGERHIQPILMIYMLILFFCFHKGFLKNELKHPIVWSFILFSSLFFLLLFISNVKSWSDSHVRNVKKSIHQMNELENNYHDELIVLTISSLELLQKKFTLRNQGNESYNNRYMIFEFYNFSMVPPYDTYLKRVLGKSNYNANDVYNYFCGQQAIYLASEDKTHLTEDYLRLIYNSDIKFKKEDFELNSNQNILVTRLVKDR